MDKEILPPTGLDDNTVSPRLGSAAEPGETNPPPVNNVGRTRKRKRRRIATRREPAAPVEPTSEKNKKRNKRRKLMKRKAMARQRETAAQEQEAAQVSETTQLRAELREVQNRLQIVENRIATARENALCKVCLETTATHTFLPCGHRCCCASCADQIWNISDVRNCPLCRQVLTTPPQRIWLPSDCQFLLN